MDGLCKISECMNVNKDYPNYLNIRMSMIQSMPRGLTFDDAFALNAMQITSFLAGASAADFLNTQGYLLGSATAFVDQITNCIGTDQLD